MGEFSCDHCDKSSNQTAGLSLHVRENHTSKKNHKWPTCDKEFPQKDYRNRHMKISCRRYRGKKSDTYPHCNIYVTQDVQCIILACDHPALKVK